jgi:hypothetical protein
MTGWQWDHNAFYIITINKLLVEIAIEKKIKPNFRMLLSEKFKGLMRKSANAIQFVTDE